MNLIHIRRHAIDQDQDHLIKINMVCFWEYYDAAWNIKE